MRKKKNQLISEVHALRAFYLFMIVETYGPASHYADTPSQSVITEGYQPGIAVFYKKILEDLDIAFQYLDIPQNTQWGRMNIGVAKTLKMRVLMALAAYDDAIITGAGYTKQQCYDEVVRLCNSVINDYNYKLLDNYASVFDVNNQINDEIIWSIQYTSDLVYNGMDLTDIDANSMHRYFVGWYNKSAKTRISILMDYGAIPACMVVNIVVRCLPIIISVFSISLINVGNRLSRLRGAESRITGITSPTIRIRYLSGHWMLFRMNM